MNRGALEDSAERQRRLRKVLWEGQNDKASNITQSFVNRVVSDGGSFVVDPYVASRVLNPLYFDSDWLFFPIARKSGHLYSMLPLSGTGDLAFTRSSSAVESNSLGAMVSQAAGMPRLDFRYGGRINYLPGYVSEDTRQNATRNTEDFSQATWGLDNITTTSSAVPAPRDGATMRVLTETATNTAHSLFQANGEFSTGFPQTLTASIFVRKHTNVGSPDIIQLYFRAGGFSTLPFANFNMATGQFTRAVNCTTFSEDWGNGIYRIAITAATTSSATNAGIALAFCNNDPNANRLPTYAGNTNNSVFAWGTQLEALPMMSSYISAGSSFVVRAEDNAVDTTLSFQSSNGFSLYGSIWVNQEATGLGRTISFVSENGNLSDSVGLFILNNQLTLRIRRANVIVGDISVSVPATGKISFGYRVQNNDVVLFANGVASTAITSITIPSVNRINVGRGASDFSQPFGRILVLGARQAILSDRALQTYSLL